MCCVCGFFDSYGWVCYDYQFESTEVWATAIKQKSYKCDDQLITWLTGTTRPAGSCNLVTLKTNFGQYKNFV